MTNPQDTRDVDALVAAIAEGARPKYLFFWGHTARGDQPGPWVLSQWFPSPFTVEGTDYATTEHWMMAGKAKLFGDDEIHDRVLKARTAGEAKKLGRSVRGFDDARWQAHRFERVVQGNVHKFSQHPARLDYLLATAQRVLVEASPTDRIWGIGLTADHRDATRPREWPGLNLLGFALMEARARLLVDATPTG
jgi:ribA/ribD-fused uncharacterized protein